MTPVHLPKRLRTALFRVLDHHWSEETRDYYDNNPDPRHIAVPLMEVGYATGYPEFIAKRDAESAAKPLPFRDNVVQLERNTPDE